MMFHTVHHRNLTNRISKNDEPWKMMFFFSNERLFLVSKSMLDFGGARHMKSGQVQQSSHLTRLRTRRGLATLQSFKMGPERSLQIDVW